MAWVPVKAVGAVLAMVPLAYTGRKNLESLMSRPASPQKLLVTSIAPSSNALLLVAMPFVPSSFLLLVAIFGGLGPNMELPRPDGP